MTDASTLRRHNPPTRGSAAGSVAALATMVTSQPVTGEVGSSRAPYQCSSRFENGRPRSTRHRFAPSRQSRFRARTHQGSLRLFRIVDTCHHSPGKGAAREARRVHLSRPGIVHHANGQRRSGRLCRKHRRMSALQRPRYFPQHSATLQYGMNHRRMVGIESALAGGDYHERKYNGFGYGCNR